MRSSIITTESYLELLGQTATRVWRGRGRFKQSVADSSFDAWTKFYKQDESAPNNIVSYYTKGSLIALALDLTIRQATGDNQSLDDLMRLLWQHYGKIAKGIPEGEIENLASQIAGRDLSGFFADYLYATDDPPLKDLFDGLGIDFCLRPSRNADDKGGDGEREEDKNRPAIYFGARVVNDSIGARLSHVFDDSPAQKAGLSAGDVIIAINNIKVDKSNLESMLANYPIDGKVKLHAFRRDELFETPVILEQAPADTVYFELQSEATPSQLSARNSWLHAQNDKQPLKQAVND